MQAERDVSPHPGMGFAEFVACMAGIQATVAIAIDMMVPALGQIASTLAIGGANQRQWVITAFLLGFGGAQIIYGVLADRFGRRPVLLFALCLYVFGACAAAAAPSFAWLLTARALQGVGAAGGQVLTVSIIRDCYAGRRMAQVNSLTFMVFLAAPIFAPSLGQLVLLIAPWPAIFLGLGAYGALVTLWVALRLPETQNLADRRAVAWQEVTNAVRLLAQNGPALGYTLAMTCLLGSWIGFINSAQQVFAGVFQVPKLFPVIFAACSICMAIAAFINSRLVARLGMRPLSHLALLGYLAISCAQGLAAFTGHQSLLVFALLQSGMMFSFGLLAGNSNAIAMEPFGHIAGVAASVQGFVSLLGAACIGALVGGAFDGTLRPLTLGFCICSAGGLACVLAAERGRLFQTQTRPQPS